jgi:predicted nucleic acid-binding protein
MNALIDTNVILDALMSRAPFHESSEQIFMLAAQDKLEANITASSVTDIYYLLHKHLHEAEPCKQMLQKLFTLFRVLDVNGADCERALGLEMADYEDALLASCAKRNKIERIITRNTKDFTASPVKAVSPEEFLQIF